LYLYKEAIVEEALTIPGFSVNTVLPGSTDYLSLSGDLSSPLIVEGTYYFSIRVST
jgi:hypothetical protein